MAKIETQNSDSPLKTWISPLSHFAPLISQNFQTPLVFLGLKKRVSPPFKRGERKLCCPSSLSRKSNLRNSIGIDTSKYRTNNTQK